jgi:3-hydroxyisobutyrate dehydrogenase
VTVSDATPGRAAAFAKEHKAKAATSNAALARDSDIVILMLPTSTIDEKVLTEADGVLAGLRHGALVIVMTSGNPSKTKELAEKVAAKGGTLMDAPVSGGVPRATDGSLAIMIGGDKAAVEQAKPVLGKMGTRLFEVGGPGNGHAMKALNNFVAGTGFIAVAEAVLVGQRFGLDPAVMIDVMNVSTGKNFNTENVVKQHVISGAFASGFALGLLAKDVGIAADLAAAIDVESPLTRLSSALLGEARDKVGGEKDHTLAYTYWEKRGSKPAAE